MSGAPIFVAATQGTLLDCLALEARRVCVPASHSTVTMGDSSWQATTPRVLYRQKTESHPQSFCERRPPCWSMSFGVEGRLLV